MKDIRVAIYYSNKYGRNDGPPLYWKYALENIGGPVKVTHLLAEGDTKKFGPFDIHLWVDWGEDSLPWEFWLPPEDGGKRVYVGSDTHLGRKHRFRMAEWADVAFFNQKTAVDEYRGLYRVNLPKNTKVVEWLPHAVEPKAYPYTKVIKTYDVCFIGHLQEEKNIQGMNRVDALDRLFREFPNFYFGTRIPLNPEKNMFEDAAHRFSESRIVFNISIKDDVNMRTFEALSSGSMVLTNELPTLGELFTPGTHLVTYDSYDDMVKKAKYYLSHDKEREKIAAAGMKEVLSKHTYTHRALHMLKTCGYTL